MSKNIKSYPCRVLCLIIFSLLLPTGSNGWAQVAPSVVPQSQMSLSGGAGWTLLSQFASPALVGSLYLTPDWPLTGYYPLYPGNFSQIIPEDGLLVGPIRLHPFMGVAEMYTDNVLRTNANRKSDFSTTLGPGIQARLPFAGRHDFVVDYRTNIQYYQRTPSNDVQDQTASGRFRFDFPGGLKLDLEGEHKLGHDPRGSAVDTQALDVNKWTTNSFLGQAEYRGAQAGVRLNLQSTRWGFINNGQGIFRDRLSNYAGMTFFADLTGKTSALVNVGVNQEIYDENKNLDNSIYAISGGGTWNVTGLTFAQILVGYQHLKFTHAQVNQPGPVLSQFQRDKDSYSNLFVMGNLNWKATPLLTINLQPYRTFQPTAFVGSLFFVATGANLSARHELTDRTALTLNLGIEEDKFTSSSGTGGTDRTDTLKNVAVGLNYRAVKWVGVSVQYMFEDRTSTQDQFKYNANTVMVSAQILF